MLIQGLQKLTLLDYPQHTACTVFLGGCNFRCPFCHNFELVDGSAAAEGITEEEFFAFLDKRHGLLDGVCITGGEPTLRPELPELIKKIKKLGFKVKLDTNGSNPQVIQKLLENQLLDYIAMDIKAGPDNYDKVAGAKVNMDAIKDSIHIIMNSSIDYEFRTTVVEPLHTLQDFQKIGPWLKGAKQYFLQPFVDRDTVPTEGLATPSEEQLQKYLTEIQRFIPNAKIRGK